MNVLTVTITETLPVQTLPLWRVLHDAELPASLQAEVRAQREAERKAYLATLSPLKRLWEIIWRPNLPEVFPLNGESTPFGHEWQELSWVINYPMSGDKWRSLYAYNRAFTNNTGFNGSEPRADYVNELDLEAELPRWDKTRLCGGATITGTVVGDHLVVDILDGNGDAPTKEWLLARPWYYFHAVNSTYNGITRFPQNDGNPVLVPLVGSGEATIPLANLERVDFICDPYQYGSVPSPYV